MLRGRRIVAVDRRGKYLWFVLDSHQALLAHLGMSGQFLLRAPDAVRPTHARLRIRFSEGENDLWFADQRTFGALAVCALVDDLPRDIRHIAVDVLDERFDVRDFHRRLTRRTTGIKRALLDQTLISGVGNIYADEALWRARLHYATPTASMRFAVTQRLTAAVRDVFREALQAGGTTFDGLYVNVNGRSGYFSRSLAVYGRAGRPCPRCETPIRREPFMGRSSFRCPRCQPTPRRPHW